jgi:hypothetical protein
MNAKARLGDVLIAPADDPYEFQYTPGPVGVTPVDSDHVGKWIVLLEPIANGQIGRKVYPTLLHKFIAS